MSSGQCLLVECTMHDVLASDNSRPLSWQSQLSDLVTDPVELCRLLALDPDDLDIAAAALKAFPLRVTRPFLARMEKGNPRDPLLLQVLPSAAELLAIPGYSEDPLAENSSRPAAGILHKYAGRLLLMPTSSCAVHCRYCFRRHFPYADHIPGKAAWADSLEYLRQTPSLCEVILSGGDPLTLSDRHLQWLLGELEAIPHLRRLRIHTRVPVMLPDRVTPALSETLDKSHLETVLVLHSNHARELDGEVAAAMKRLHATGTTLLNQSVLLRGINDDVATLARLSEALHAMHVLPYYLHLPDKTAGTAHFDVSEKEALALHAALQAILPGYLVPRLAREEPGHPGKTLLGHG